jgi:hypothetical protein
MLDMSIPIAYSWLAVTKTGEGKVTYWKFTVSIWAATNGHLDDVESSRIGEFETGFYRFLESTYGDLLPAIAKEKAISDEMAAKLGEVVAAYREQAGFGSDEKPKAGKPKADEPKADEPKADESKADEKQEAKG